MTTKVTVIPPEKPRYVIEVDHQTAAALLAVAGVVRSGCAVLGELYEALKTYPELCGTAERIRLTDVGIGSGGRAVRALDIISDFSATDA
jgi:hypothetical protein